VLLKFRTIDNTIRWVDQRYIQLQETLWAQKQKIM
jgi:hypothetical protein